MDHEHKIHQPKIDSKNLLFTIVLNSVITIAQVVGGIISGSLSLISDAIHNFSDVLSLVFSYFANRLSRKKASENQTFGYKRAEIIVAFVNASTLLIVSLFLVYGAINRFLNPEIIGSDLVIWLSILGIVVNGLSVFILKSDADKNLNMQSAYLHLFSDMLASVAVLIGGLLMKYYQYYWVDSLLTLFIAIYLFVVAIKLLRKSTNFLMLFTPKHIKISDIISEVHSISGVRKLHHIHVWHLNEDELHLEAHLDCVDNISMTEFNLLLQKIEAVLFQKFKINHITIQPEYKKEEVSKDFIVQD